MAEQINFWSRARAHVSSAETLLGQTGEMSARYACLELRLALEAVAYEWLQMYLAEMRHLAMAKWQVGPVMRELITADPWADRSRVVSFQRSGDGEGAKTCSPRSRWSGIVPGVGSSRGSQRILSTKESKRRAGAASW